MRDHHERSWLYRKNANNDWRRYYLWDLHTYSRQYTKRPQNFLSVTSYTSKIWENVTNIKSACTSPGITTGKLKFRPIIAQTGTCTYSTNQVIAEYLKHIIYKNPFIIHNMQDFPSILKPKLLETDEGYVSYDVESLFTSKPVRETMYYTSLLRFTITTSWNQCLVS